MDDMLRLEAIVDYNMDVLEARAYKILLLWLDKSRLVFPAYNHARMRRTGDPRKSQLFKYCYKLARETQGILDEEHYPLYVRAQLEILKALSKKNHVLVDIMCLVGDKAWVRWKLWKKKYDQRAKVIVEEKAIPVNQLKLVDALNKTREFLVQTFGTEICLAKYQEAKQNFQRWIALGKISPYYLVLSPLVAKTFPDGVDKIVPTLDLQVYRQVITPEIEAHFAQVFSNEMET